MTSFPKTKIPLILGSHKGNGISEVMQKPDLQQHHRRKIFQTRKDIPTHILETQRTLNREDKKGKSLRHIIANSQSIHTKVEHKLQYIKCKVHVNETHQNKR